MMLKRKDRHLVQNIMTKLYFMSLPPAVFLSACLPGRSPSQHRKWTRVCSARHRKWTGLSTLRRDKQPERAINLTLFRADMGPGISYGPLFECHSRVNHTQNNWVLQDTGAAMSDSKGQRSRQEGPSNTSIPADKHVQTHTSGHI